MFRPRAPGPLPRPRVPSSGYLWLTVAASVAVAVSLGAGLLERLRSEGLVGAVEQAVFATIVLFLIYGSLVYQLTRRADARRVASQPAPMTDDLERVFDEAADALVVLLPSYKEEPRVVRQALLSAAVQDHPNRRVVLLIDDPPEPASRQDAELLEVTRRLPGEIARMLEEPAAWSRRAFRAFTVRAATGDVDLAAETMALADLHRHAMRWFAREAALHPRDDHADRFVADRILGFRAQRHRTRADVLEARVRRGTPLTLEELFRGFSRIAAAFTVHVSSFERKRYVNLAHEPNKAMNLNSYIGLMGGRYIEVRRDDGLHLVPAGSGRATLVVPDAPFVITLDADSLLLPDYALKLAHIARQPGNERLAVLQTPYSAIPGSTRTLERVAGATTDVQYLIHQGLTRYGATFWVGANALLRRSALDEIAVDAEERGFPVRKFVQDRTVIEDTESSIDLRSRGWQLYNHPERLSYSATPPDFGSLLIQRRRWANGGLLIVPKLLGHLFTSWRAPRAWSEAFMRFHYLTSLAGVNAGLLALMCYPFHPVVWHVWLPIAAVPYFVLYARDLRAMGYRRGDFVRVYALNLMLVPINLGGVIKSLQQALCRSKTPFGRTPKVRHRTVVPALYVLLELALLLYLGAALVFDAAAGRWVHAALIGMNVVLLAYAVTVYMGWREAFEDLVGPLRASWRKNVDRRTPLRSMIPRRSGPHGERSAASSTAA